MYKTATKLVVPFLAAVAASFIWAEIAVAGTAGGPAEPPGKPGNNDIVPGGNIVEIAIEANDALGVFDTVLAAAQCDFFEGAVVAILAGDDKVTLFAPTDTGFGELGLDEFNVCDAFDGMDEGDGTPEDLLTILGYHVTEGRRFSNSLFNRNGNPKEVEMLLGGYITTAEGKIYDNHMREVNTVEGFININASNGVIHVIDRVLLP
jgi:uncharacterized surface protein with fasciclin (FAS1) repeats